MKFRLLSFLVLAVSVLAPTGAAAAAASHPEVLVARPTSVDRARRAHRRADGGADGT